MKEFKAIIQAYDDATARGLQTILTSVVHVEGSAYRRAGARMLINESGQMTLHQQKNKLITYDTSDENDAVIGAQLGCNGVIQVLFEPIDIDHKNNPIECMRRICDAQQDAVLVSVFNSNKTAEQKGSIFLALSDGTTFQNGIDKRLKTAIIHESKLALKAKHSHFAEMCEDVMCEQLFFQFVPRVLHLVIVGAGNDAIALASMATTIGWKVSVQDGRPTHANKDRFTAGCQVIVSKPEDTLKHLILDDRTHIVLMSHNYAYDFEVFKLLLPQSNLPYIGILGPKKKYDRMLADLNDANIQLTPVNLAKVYSPVGLNIGAETPDEIALSIIAEIQAVYAKREQHHLKDEQGPIHDRVSPIFKAINL